MSDVSLLNRLISGVNSAPSACRLTLEKSPVRPTVATSHTLTSLPFDILLGIAQFLEPEDILALRMTCRHLMEFSQSRAIWLTMAIDMLELCRPLPLSGFKNITDMATPELSRLVRTGRQLHRNWTTEGSSPKLIRPHATIDAPHEDIVWLSPITVKYLLCCTRRGRVLCWDLQLGACVAEWSCGADWEIWKCRVEYEERTVYFAMAKRGSDKISADCQLVCLRFSDEDDIDPKPPVFETLAIFTLPGHVVSVYLLDPLRRLLSAYIWIEPTNQLGLYMLLDWSIPIYVYINTGISFDHQTRELSCIGYDPENVVIHAEEETRAIQSFYPYSFLHEHSSQTPPKGLNPPLVLPPRTYEAAFLPTVNPFAGRYQTQNAHFVRQWWPLVPNSQRLTRRSCTILLQTMNVPQPGPGDPPPGPGDPPPGTHLFTIAQHYFSVPLSQEKLRWWYTSEPFEIVCYPHLPDFNFLPVAMEEAVIPFDIGVQEEQQAMNGENGTEVVAVEFLGPVPENEQLAGGEGEAEAVMAGVEEDANMALEQLAEHGVSVSPLVAVDFGCAVWLEYKAFDSEELRLRYVSFPSVDIDRSASGYNGLSSPGAIHTLEVPPEIDLKRVCHIGVDQAQGTVILGMRSSAIYVLRYT